jgi:hypothetical protein
MTAEKTTCVDIERHSRECRICAHPDRDEIEREFCEWKALTTIARERRISRAAFYRHVRALGLFDRRDRNIKAALANFIERGSTVKVTAASFVAAIQAYSKINAAGEWVDKNEDVNATHNLALFDKMTRGEMLRYAQTGELPEWWSSGDTR